MLTFHILISSYTFSEMCVQIFCDLTLEVIPRHFHHLFYFFYHVLFVRSKSIPHLMGRDYNRAGPLGTHPEGCLQQMASHFSRSKIQTPYSGLNPARSSPGLLFVIWTCWAPSPFRALAFVLPSTWYASLSTWETFPWLILVSAYKWPQKNQPQSPSIISIKVASQ